MMKVRFGRDKKGEYHEGYPIFRVQENGKLLILCPFGHVIAYDVPQELAHYYERPIKCYGRL